MAAPTDSRSSAGSSKPASHRRPLTPNRSEHGGLGCSRRCRLAWISFLDRDLERTSCSRRASRRRRIRQRSSGIDTASSSPFHSKFANARASSLSVLARALTIPVSSGLTTTTRLTCGSRIRQTSQQLPVTSNATRSDGNRLCANDSTPSGVAATRPTDRTRPSSQIATAQKSRCTSKADRTTDPSDHCHPSPPQLVLMMRENQRDNDTDRYELYRSIQARPQGRPNEKPGLEAHRSFTAYPSAFSQTRPLSRIDRPYGHPRADLDQQFHASRSTGLGGAAKNEQLEHELAGDVKTRAPKGRAAATSAAIMPGGTDELGARRRHTS
jgi:hypothetical protein